MQEVQKHSKVSKVRKKTLVLSLELIFLMWSCSTATFLDIKILMDSIRCNLGVTLSGKKYKIV